MTLGVYSNSYVPREKYAIKDSTANSGMGKNGQNSFLDEFVNDEAAEKRMKSGLEREEKKLEEADTMAYTMPSQAAIRDYLDNFLLINAEQVACSNMTQHLIKSDELKETLGFLNTEAAKSIFKGKKRPEFLTKPMNEQYKPTLLTTRSKNFFSVGIDSSTNNFFLK